MLALLMYRMPRNQVYSHDRLPTYVPRSVVVFSFHGRLSTFSHGAISDVTFALHHQIPPTSLMGMNFQNCDQICMATNHYHLLTICTPTTQRAPAYPIWMLSMPPEFMSVHTYVDMYIHKVKKGLPRATQTTSEIRCQCMTAHTRGPLALQLAKCGTESYVNHENRYSSMKLVLDPEIRQKGSMRLVPVTTVLAKGYFI